MSCLVQLITRINELYIHNCGPCLDLKTFKTFYGPQIPGINLVQLITRINELDTIVGHVLI